LGSIPKGSHSISQIVLFGLSLDVLYHENARLGVSSISRHKDKGRRGGFGTHSRGVRSSIQTRDGRPFLGLTGPSTKGKEAVFIISQDTRLTQIPGVMWEVDSGNTQGPTPEKAWQAQDCTCQRRQPTRTRRPRTRVTRSGSGQALSAWMTGLGKGRG
jgi:hypothetical protein